MASRSASRIEWAEFRSPGRVGSHPVEHEREVAATETPTEQRAKRASGKAASQAGQLPVEIEAH